MSALASRRAIGDALGEFRLPTGGQSWAALMASLAPAGWWRLGEASGSFADSSGNGNTGTAVSTGHLTRGATGLITGDTDAAISIDGTTGNYVDVTTFIVDKAVSVTFLLWVKTSSTTIQRFLNGASDSVTVLLNSLTPRFFAGGVTAAAPSGISDGNKHMLVGTYDAVSHAVLFYVDGVQVATATGTAQTGTGSLRIGARNTTGANAAIGTVDEAAVWNSVLTPTQIANLYAAGA